MKATAGRLWGKIYNDEIEIRTITQADVEECLDILDKSFFLNESVCNACEINLPENSQARRELRELSRQTAEDGVSLMAKRVDTGKVISVAFNKIQYIPDNSEEEPFFVDFRKHHTKSPQAQRLMDFMIEVDNETDVFQLYNIDCLCELMFLATLPEWEGKGIGRTLTRYTIELARELSQGMGVEALHPNLVGKKPRAVTALFTSEYSQKVGQSQGFKIINSVPYSRYSYNGKTFDQRIHPSHKTCVHVVVLF